MKIQTYREGDYATYYPPMAKAEQAHWPCVVLPPRPKTVKVMVKIHSGIINVVSTMTRVIRSHEWGKEGWHWVPTKKERDLHQLASPYYPCQITQVLERAKPSAKRVRIRYVSEEDPAGREIHVTVDRLAPQGELLRFTPEQLQPLAMGEFQESRVVTGVAA